MVGPASDSNGDGTVQSGEGIYDYNAELVGGRYNLSNVIYDLLVAAPNGPETTNIHIAPGKYTADSEIDLNGQGPVTITAEPGTVEIQSSVSAVFQCSGSCGDITISGLNHIGSAVLFIFTSNSSPNATIRLSNNRVYSAGTGSSGSSGLFQMFGADTAPGPSVYLDGNFCESAHFCVDLFGNADADSDGTRDGYYNVYSTSNVYIVNGNYIPPVYVNGPMGTFRGTGDIYQGNCIAFGIAAPTTGTGTPPAGSFKSVVITGSQFRVDNPTRPGVTRGVCTTYPGPGPAAIVYGATSLADDTTYDSTLDNIQITSSHFFVRAYPAETRHSYFLHRGTGATPKLYWNTYDTDTATGLDSWYKTQAGTHAFDVMAGPPTTYVSGESAGFRFDNAPTTGVSRMVGQNVILGSDFQTIINTNRNGTSGGLWIRSGTPSDLVNASHWGFTLDNQGTSITAGAAGDDQFFIFQGPTLNLISGGPDSGGVTAHGGGFVADFLPLNNEAGGFWRSRLGCLTNITSGACETIRRWDDAYLGFVDLNTDGTTQIQVESSGSASARAVAFDLDGTLTSIASTDAQILDAGIDANVDGTADCMSFQSARGAGNTGATTYHSFAGTATNTTETTTDDYMTPNLALNARQMICRTATAPDNGAGTQTWTMTLRDDGANTAVACTISEAATSCTYTGASVSVAAGSKIGLAVAPATTPAASAEVICSVCFGQ